MHAQPPLTNPIAVAAPGRRRVVVFLLFLAYTFSQADRNIVAVLGFLIREDLKLSNVQLGLLGGLYFALLYTLLGIPAARLAERFNRVSIMAMAIGLWSLFTLLCGTATSYVTLALARFGVGVGEAGLNPPMQSLVSDYFEPRRRASALSMITLGIPVGGVLGAVVSGWIAQAFSWRAAFIALSIPGIVLAIVMKLVIKDLPRGKFDQVAPPDALRADSADPASGHILRSELRDVWKTLSTLLSERSIVHLLIANLVGAFATASLAIFTPQYFKAAFGLDPTQIGLLVGLFSGLAGIGILGGGMLVDRLSTTHHSKWYMIVPAMGLGLAGAFYLLGFSQSSFVLTASFIAASSAVQYAFVGPTFASVQNFVAPRQRATAAALTTMFGNLVGAGAGPAVIGWIIDRSTQRHFHAVSGLSDVALACPGGKAPAGAADSVAHLCAASVMEGTRTGLYVCGLVCIWSSAHFAVSALTRRPVLHHQQDAEIRLP